MQDGVNILQGIKKELHLYWKTENLEIEPDLKSNTNIQKDEICEDKSRILDTTPLIL